MARAQAQRCSSSVIAARSLLFAANSVAITIEMPDTNNVSRRIERATPTLVPLQSKSRVGYVFRAPLQLI